MHNTNTSDNSNNSTMSDVSSTQGDPYDTFLEYNSLGVINLMNGNLPLAYSHLCTAFYITRNEQTIAIKQEQERSDASSSNAPLQPNQAHTTGPLGGPLAPWPLLSREEVLSTLSITKTLDVRMDGLTISIDALVRRGDRSSVLGQDDWTLASAFVAYNIGVVYLIGGTQGSNEAHQEKARTMFESSLGLLLHAFQRDRQVLNRGESEATSKRLCPTGNPIVDVLCLMVLTKAAQAYHFLSRFEGARAYVLQFADFMQLLLSDGHEYYYYADDDSINELIQSHCARLASELTSILKLETLAPAA